MDAVTGGPRWSINVRSKFQGKGTDFGYAATPLVEDDRVILPVGGPSAGLVALHADDGRTLWTASSDPASYCPALPITLGGRRLVVGYLQNALVLADIASGQIVDRHPLSTGYDEHAAWPIYREPHLMLGAPFRAPAVCLRLENSDDGAVLSHPQWTSRELANDVASSVLVGEHVFGFDLHQLQASRHRPSRGAFKCLEWSTGKVRWSTDQVGQASVLAADGKLLLLSDNGSLILARADPVEYLELARTAFFEDEICWTPPALWQGRLFVRSPSRAICLYVGSPADAPPTTATSEGPPRRWRFDISWLVSRERDYPNDAPSWEEMTQWFIACVVELSIASGATGLLLLLARRYLDRQLAAAPICWSIAFVLGLLGPGVFSALLDHVLFTWPAALYAASRPLAGAAGRARTGADRLRLLRAVPRRRHVHRLGVPVRLPGRVSAHIDGDPRRDPGPARMGGCRLDAAGVHGLFRKLPGAAAVEGGAGELARGASQGRVAGCSVGTSLACAAPPAIRRHRPVPRRAATLRFACGQSRGACRSRRCRSRSRRARRLCRPGCRTPTSRPIGAVRCIHRPATSRRSDSYFGESRRYLLWVRQVIAHSPIGAAYRAAGRQSARIRRIIFLWKPASAAPLRGRDGMP